MLGALTLDVRSHIPLKHPLVVLANVSHNGHFGRMKSMKAEMPFGLNSEGG